MTNYCNDPEQILAAHKKGLISEKDLRLYVSILNKKADLKKSLDRIPDQLLKSKDAKDIKCVNIFKEDVNKQLNALGTPYFVTSKENGFVRYKIELVTHDSSYLVA